MSVNVRETLENQGRILELMLCLDPCEFPLELTIKICANTIRVCESSEVNEKECEIEDDLGEIEEIKEIEESDETEDDIGEIEVDIEEIEVSEESEEELGEEIKNCGWEENEWEVSSTKFCCHCDVDPLEQDEFSFRCTKDDGDLEGSFCGTCRMWICGHHSNDHKFCNCGKRLFGEEEEIELDDEDIILELFTRNLVEDELETIDELELSNELFCCHIFCIDTTDNCSGIRCQGIAEKFCVDCNLAFCDDHLGGFCRCGKRISLSS